MDKVFASPEEAVADIADGSTVAVSGFGVAHNYPSSLTRALRDRGTRELCVVCNALGMSADFRPQILVENRQVRKLIASFSARPGPRSPAEEQIAAGEIELELVPQGILVGRMRAAGAGVPAFYSPTGADTVLAEGKEIRVFDGRAHVLELALPVDYALLRAHRADRFGNVQFRGSTRHFNPSFAKAARVAIVEVDEIVEPGEISPEDVGLPGIFISRVVRNTMQVELPPGTGRKGRSPDSSRAYDGRPGLSRAQIAGRAARLLPEGSYVNLGTGLPALLAYHLADRDVTLHAENGLLGYGALDDGQELDPDIYDAAGGFVAVRPGGSFFESVTSFEMARSGRLASVVLGAYQVGERGDLANWSTPEQVGGGIGGAMDLVAGAAELIVVMEHTDSRGRPKLVGECTYPLTGRACVDVVVTDLALLRRRDGRFTIEEVAPGFTAGEVADLTEMAVDIATDVRVLGEDGG
jgi:3-oxoacid CoA-transferase